MAPLITIFSLSWRARDCPMQATTNEEPPILSNSTYRPKTYPAKGPRCKIDDERRDSNSKMHNLQIGNHPILICHLMSAHVSLSCGSNGSASEYRSSPPLWNSEWRKKKLRCRAHKLCTLTSQTRCCSPVNFSLSSSLKCSAALLLPTMPLHQFGSELNYDTQVDLQGTTLITLIPS